MSRESNAGPPTGSQQSVLALLFVTGIAGLIASSTWGESQTAGRLAIGGVVVFAIAVIFGSGRLVAISSLPILGSAVVSFVGDDNPAWVRGVVVGVLWYVAAELAWDGIERRDRVRRTTAFVNRRIDEVTLVVLLSLAVSVAAIVLSQVAPTRTVFVLTIATVGLASAVAMATRGIRGSNSDEKSWDETRRM